MKDIQFKHLESHRVGGTRDRMVLSIPSPKSPSGKVYQYSPNPDAVPRLFQLGDAPENRTIKMENRLRIRREPGPGETVCPYSGHIAPDLEFIHMDDIEATKNYACWLAESDVQDWLKGLTKDFNRRQPRGGLILMEMKHKLHRRPRPLVIREDLLRSLDCNVCKRSYGVYALALYCPDCGAPNLALHFNRETELIHEQISLADQKQDEDRNEIAFRLMGNAHEDVLTAFETTLKTVYCHLVRKNFPDKVSNLCTKKAIGNVFQNIDRTRESYGNLGIEPFNTLSVDDLEYLQLNIQKRHVLGHNLGMADEHYTEITQEQQPGETVNILGDEIRRFANLCGHVVADLEQYIFPNARLSVNQK